MSKSRLNPLRRATWRIACALVLGAATLAAQAQNYRDKPIKFVVPYPPGGMADTYARLLGQALSDRVGQPVVTENKPGGSLIIGTEAAAKAPADGYTILLASVSSLALNVSAFRKLPYDPVRDFSPVSMTFTTPLFLMVNADLPVKSLADLIAYARANPGKLSYASLGYGSSLHIAGEVFKKMAGIDILHVPYKGTTTALPDRDPLPRWTQGPVTLLGDAAHPMLPYLAQGACMAIEDGYSVAACLARHPGDVPGGLKDYEEARRARTARVQLLARARAVENHLNSPIAQLKRNIRYALQRFTDPAKHTYKIERIYGHDVTAA